MKRVDFLVNRTLTLAILLWGAIAIDGGSQSMSGHDMKSDSSKMGQAHHEGSAHTTIKISAKTDSLATIGSPIHVKISLSEVASGQPVTPEMLKIAHTQKVHLLIIDRSLTDYHHEHPTPTDHAGEYDFTFTPLCPGPYRIWADLVPTATAAQEYVFTDLPVDGEPLPISDTAVRLADTAGGLRFTLTMDKQALTLGKATMLTIRVSKADGADFTDLEPVMSAYAHLVAFETDLKTILHVHPMGAEPSKQTDRGGPSLTFHLEPQDKGFIRLFAQVQVDGKPIYARFGLTVQ